MGHQSDRASPAKPHGSNAPETAAQANRVDPREISLATKADCWLRVKPGADGELAMAMIHVLLEENLLMRNSRADGPTRRIWFAPITVNY